MKTKPMEVYTELCADQKTKLITVWVGKWKSYTFWRGPLEVEPRQADNGKHWPAPAAVWEAARKA